MKKLIFANFFAVLCVISFVIGDETTTETTYEDYELPVEKEFEIINSLSDDGSFKFSTYSGEDEIVINGNLTIVNGTKSLRLNGVYKYEGYEVKFSADENGYKVHRINYGPEAPTRVISSILV